MLLGALGTRTVPYLLYSIATKLATCKHPPGSGLSCGLLNIEGLVPQYYLGLGRAI